MAKRKKSEVERTIEYARHVVAGSYAQRHPERARQERALKQANAAVKRDFGHKLNGTPETHAKAARTMQGALARLYVGGHIDLDQLSAAAEIAGVAERIGRDAGLRTVSLETRVDGGSRIGAAFFEALGAVRREVAYTRWRGKLATFFPAQPELVVGPVIAVIVDDLAVRTAARRWRMRDAKLIGLLGRALDLWPDIIGAVAREIDEDDLELAHIRLGVVTR